VRTQAGDARRADAYGAGVEALAAYALSRDSGSPDQAPIAVFNGDDINAIIEAAGLERIYAYHDLARGRHHYVTTVALWDAEAKAERHLSFDFLDSIERLRSSEEFAGYPVHRERARNAIIEAQAERGDELAKDIVATRAYYAAPEGPARIDALRESAATGGLVSLSAWMDACDGKPVAECSGLVDALLPLAEKDLALFRVQLALAYARASACARTSTPRWCCSIRPARGGVAAMRWRASPRTGTTWTGTCRRRR
jgi:hypothetical protein